jgi:hypothetical protein
MIGKLIYMNTLNNIKWVWKKSLDIYLDTKVGREEVGVGPCEHADHRTPLLGLYTTLIDNSYISLSRTLKLLA